MPVQNAGQSGAQEPKSAVPPTAVVLAKQPRRRIPRAVVAVEQSAPVGNERQQYPDRFGQRTGEMGDAGIDGNNQIHVRGQRRGVGEILQLFAEMNNVAPFSPRSKSPVRSRDEPSL